MRACVFLYTMFNDTSRPIQLACVEVTNEFIFDLYILRICNEKNLPFITSDCVLVILPVI